METNSEETSQRPLFLLLGSLLVVLVLFVVAVGVYLLFIRPAAPPPMPGYVGQTACDHPFFPLRQGATWHYSGAIAVNDGRFPFTSTWTVAQVHSNETTATAIVIVRYQYDADAAEIIETIAYTCAPAGISRDSLIVRAETQTVSQYGNHSGTYLLPPAQFVRGAEWQYLYNVITDYAPPGTDYVWSYAAKDVETIDNEAGTFDTLRVEGSRSEPAGSDSSTEWFAFGVGQVHSERVQTEGGVDVVSTMTLLSYNLPE